MKTNYELRYASNPRDAKSYDTTRLREDFLIQNLFVNNEVNMVYSMYDRLIVGGAKPVGEVLTLEAIDPLKATHFLSRRELGIFNVVSGILCLHILIVAGWKHISILKFLKEMRFAILWENRPKLVIFG